MSAAILHVDALVQCSHPPGLAQARSSFPRVKVSGKAVIRSVDLYDIKECGLSSTSTPPCAVGAFTQGAKKVLAGGLPVVTLTSESTCTPTGTPMKPVTAQTRVRAT
jgi:hypothetical protein